MCHLIKLLNNWALTAIDGEVICTNAGLPNLIAFNVFMFVITLLLEIRSHINKLDYEIKVNIIQPSNNVYKLWQL